MLNLSGLALGLTTSLLILLWVRDELSYDQYHDKLGRLYFVWHNLDQSGGQVRTVSDTQGQLAPALLEEMPEVANAARLTFSQDMLFTVEEKRFKEAGRYADPALFEMFSFPLVAGNPRTVLRDPSSIAISDSLAYKYFGGIGQALGQAIRVDNKDSYTGPKLVLIYVLLIGRRPVLNMPVVAKVCSIVAFCGFSSPEKDFGRGVA